MRGTTEGVNLVANSWGRKYLGAGDEIVLTTLEHHSNIVPWQFLAEQIGAVIRVVPVTDRGEVLLNDFERTLGTAHADCRLHPRVERTRYGAARRRDDPDGPSASARAC